ncbi:MAG: L,D-transpeptidase family protein [Actinomycetospora chiangmaiensis]|nr:L,D-transpeptidase family protein [Actinomycetospora chiangmaiensis]
MVLATTAAVWSSAAVAGGAYGGVRHIPGVGLGTPGVDTYIENPDPQPPVVWSQGTAAPPPQGDYGGGFIQYMITGSERRPAQPVYGQPRPRYGLAGPVPAPGPVASYPGGYAQPGAYATPDPYSADPGAAYAANPVQAALNPMFRRQEVAFAGAHAPGTIVIDTASKFLYLVESPGRALRYGIGVGRPGFLWRGEKSITRKAEWPDWTPPPEMLLRRPDLPRHMEGGIANPLGARAMYLGSSLYRIHGTNEPNTIGTNVSSGCIRLTNDDVADLYGRVRVGTRVIVM